MVAIRHILVHAYDVIDAVAVWRVVREHLPFLEQQIRQALACWLEGEQSAPSSGT